MQAHRGDGARHRLAEGIAAFHGRLRRQVGVDVDRQHRSGMAEMGQRNADGVVDLGGRAERRVEVLPVELAHQLEGDLARDLPVEFAAGEVAGRLAADMHREGRRRGVEKLLGVIVGEDDPEVGLERAQPLADVGGHLPDVLHDLLVLGLRHREELRGMGQHRAADDGRIHGLLPCPGIYRPTAGQQVEGRSVQGIAALHRRGRRRYARPRFRTSAPATSITPATSAEHIEEARWPRCQ